MLSATLSLAVVAVSIFCWVRFRPRFPDKFPPGPRQLTLPLVGNALELRNGGIWRLRKKYGDVLGLYYGPRLCVYVGKLSLLQELGASPDFENKLQYPLVRLLRGGSIGGRGSGREAQPVTSPGFIHGQGPAWAEQRRFTLHKLRDLGLGRSGMAEIIQHQAAQLCRALEETGGQPTQAVGGVFSLAALASLWQVVTGKELEYKDPKLARIVAMVDQMARDGGDSVLRHLLGRHELFAQLVYRLQIASNVRAFEEAKKLLKQEIEEHRRTYSKDHMRDFVDHYLSEMNERSQKADETNSSFVGADGELSLLNVMLDLFLAGSDTTSAVLSWGMIFLLESPQVALRMQEELDAVTGRSRLPKLEDRIATPYTEAVVHEILRLSNLTPMLGTHTMVRDCYIDNGKYFVPKDTRIIMHFESILLDPQQFPNPQKFNPLRFIGADGTFQPHPQVVPFGVGRRRCLGEMLARSTLYVFFASIISQFTLQKPHPSDHLCKTGNVGGNNKPYPFKMRFVQRQ